MRTRSTSRARSAPQLALALTAAFGMVASDCLPIRSAWSQAPQQAAANPADARLSQAQLEQMLAPIALYPDDLLMQMLMASTYPMEVVQASRWLARDNNAALKGDALVKALEGQSWDASVKSLVPFPDVLAMMNDKLEWTQALGDALLAQQDDVFNAIQVLRNRANDAGKLQSGPQQTVNVSQNVTVATPAPGAPPPVVAPPPQVITIAPTQPDRVYVPAYDPNVMFGAWPYPSYPPVYYPPPVGWGVGNALLTGMAFATGAAIVGSLWGWARPAWGRGYVDIDVNRVNNINVNRNQITSNRWQHDVNHRQGVPYRNDDVRNRFQGGGGGDRAQAARDQFRGRVQGDRPGGGFGDRPGGGLGDRGPGGGLGDRGPGGGLGDRGPGGGLGDRGPGGGLGDRGPGGGLGDRGPGGGLGGQGPGGGLGNRGPGSGPGGQGPGSNLGNRLPGGGPGDRTPGGGNLGSNLADRTPGNLGGARPSTLPGQGAGGARPSTLPGSAGGARPSTLPGSAGGARPSTLPGSAGGARPGGIGQAPSGRPTISQPPSRPSGAPAMQGLGQGGDVRAAAQRGQASRQAPVSRPAPQNFGGGGARQAAGGGNFGGGGARQAGGGNFGGGARAGGGGGGGRRGR